jgi:hypothetical protein
MKNVNKNIVMPQPMQDQDRLTNQTNYVFTLS